MSNFSIIKTKLALVISIFSLSDRQWLSFTRDILVNKARCRASLIFFFDFLILLDDFLDSYLLFADSEHISLFDYVLLRRQALDYNPRLLLGLGILANYIVVRKFLDLLFFIGLYEVNDGIYATGTARFFDLEGKKTILSIIFKHSGRLSDIDDPDFHSVGLHGVIIEVGVGLLPSLA